jgi:signal transduction histidine kinase
MQAPVENFANTLMLSPDFSQPDGLGLSIVKRLVQAQGGETWAEQADGLFRLWISLLPADGSRRAGAIG